MERVVTSDFFSGSELWPSPDTWLAHSLHGYSFLFSFVSCALSDTVLSDDFLRSKARRELGKRYHLWFRAPLKYELVGEHTGVNSVLCLAWLCIPLWYPLLAPPGTGPAPLSGPVQQFWHVCACTKWSYLMKETNAFSYNKTKKSSNSRRGDTVTIAIIWSTLTKN